MTDQEHIRALRDQLAALRARHDTGAIPHAPYNVIINSKPRSRGTSIAQPSARPPFPPLH
jgi:hypothetical protein